MPDSACDLPLDTCLKLQINLQFVAASDVLGKDQVTHYGLLPRAMSHRAGQQKALGTL